LTEIVTFICNEFIKNRCAIDLVSLEETLKINGYISAIDYARESSSYNYIIPQIVVDRVVANGNSR
jgi:hypothetical protein